MSRRLMLRNDSGGFLYPLVPGTKTYNYFTFTTSENGHVVMRCPGRQTSNKYVNLRDVARYFTTANISQMNCPLWFELKAGQECVFEALNKPSYVALFLYVASSTTAYKALYGSQRTFTVESDVEIGCVGLRTASSVEAGTTKEFDISLVVDGRRYF